eukprot:TRINITY_DN118_c0_g2_i6.p1 TRINITY_DN118_c0_g2~~TRINITY_DN118_c0_g2_i6.p1  ORF type:complete len:512 (+),score=116.56 TRINITY_DN118_c0_g2_i6:198-1733(+)
MLYLHSLCFNSFILPLFSKFHSLLTPFRSISTFHPFSFSCLFFAPNHLFPISHPFSIAHKHISPLHITQHHHNNNNTNNNSSNKHKHCPTHTFIHSFQFVQSAQLNLNIIALISLTITTASLPKPKLSIPPSTPTTNHLSPHTHTHLLPMNTNRFNHLADAMDNLSADSKSLFGQLNHNANDKNNNTDTTSTNSVRNVIEQQTGASSSSSSVSTSTSSVTTTRDATSVHTIIRVKRKRDEDPLDFLVLDDRPSANLELEYSSSDDEKDDDAYHRSKRMRSGEEHGDSLGSSLSGAKSVSRRTTFQPSSEQIARDEHERERRTHRRVFRRMESVSSREANSRETSEKLLERIKDRQRKRNVLPDTPAAIERTESLAKEKRQSHSNDMRRKQGRKARRRKFKGASGSSSSSSQVRDAMSELFDVHDVDLFNTRDKQSMNDVIDSMAELNMMQQYMPLVNEFLKEKGEPIVNNEEGTAFAHALTDEPVKYCCMPNYCATRNQSQTHTFPVERKV